MPRPADLLVVGAGPVFAFTVSVRASARLIGRAIAGRAIIGRPD